MALINCGECAKQVSDRATSCPGCACPIGGPPARAAPQTVEMTGKNWKFGQLIFGLILAIGLAGALAGANPSASGGMLAVGGVGYLIVRIGAWWHHG